ncbi:hypothetical protein L9F63_013700, partial [Diploptera punctata]
NKGNTPNIVSPEFKYDIGFSPSRKVCERQEFIISNTLIFSTFVTTQYSNIRIHLEKNSLIYRTQKTIYNTHNNAVNGNLHLT